jgi:hypothetical protein
VKPAGSPPPAAFDERIHSSTRKPATLNLSGRVSDRHCPDTIPYCRLVAARAGTRPAALPGVTRFPPAPETSRGPALLHQTPMLHSNRSELTTRLRAAWQRFRPTAFRRGQAAKQHYTDATRMSSPWDPGGASAAGPPGSMCADFRCRRNSVIGWQLLAIISATTDRCKPWCAAVREVLPAHISPLWGWRRQNRAGYRHRQRHAQTHLFGASATATARRTFKVSLIIDIGIIQTA